MKKREARERESEGARVRGCEGARERGSTASDRPFSEPPSVTYLTSYVQVPSSPVWTLVMRAVPPSLLIPGMVRFATSTTSPFSYTTAAAAAAAAAAGVGEAALCLALAEAKCTASNDLTD